MNWQNVTVKLSALQPWEHNPRSMTKRQAQRLLKSWQDLGQFQTIAIGPQGQVYDGHQRLSALLAAYGPQFAIDARQSDRELSDEERRYLTAQANLPVGQWNWDALAGWDAAQLQEWGFDDEALRTWNSDAANLATMLTAEQQGSADAEPQIDRAAELNEKWQVKTGDLWRIGEHRLLCGDSTKREDVERVMDCIASIEIHDPPYGMDLDTDYSKMPSTKPEGNKEYRAIIGDDKPFDYYSIPDLGCSERFMFGADYYAKTLPDGGSWLVWDKRVDDKFDAMFGSAFELIWSREKHKRDFIRCNNTLFSGEAEARNKLHPTTKPTKVIAWLIGKYGGHIVADWFCGSGTTLVACQNLQRKCRAIEISPNYCAVILERMETAFPGIEIERIA